MPTDKNGLRERIADAFELPREVICDIPLVTMTGRGSLSIENYKALTEYSDTLVRINTSAGCLCIHGTGLELGLVSNGAIIVNGNIQGAEYSI